MNQIKIWLLEPAITKFAAELGIRTVVEILVIVGGVGFGLSVLVKAAVEIVQFKLARRKKV